MNDEEEFNTYLIDNDPTKLLPYSKRLVPEDPEAVTLGRRFIRNSVIDSTEVEL